MTNIHEVSMTNKDLAQINHDQNNGMAHAEFFDNSEYLVEFRRKLENQPRNIQVNKIASSSQKTVYYIPIDSIEAELDNIYKAGNWYTQNFQFYQMGSLEVPVWNKQKNGYEIKAKALMGCSIELVVINRAFESPVPVKYIGVSSDYVSPKQGVTFLPKLKAEALKNAASQIGNVFGRNLNRNIKDNSYAQNTSTEIIQEISQANSIEELNQIVQGEGINNEISTAIAPYYTEQFAKLFRAQLKKDLKTVKSRKSFEDVMRSYQETYPAAKDYFRNDAECVKILSEVSRKYPPKK